MQDVNWCPLPFSKGCILTSISLKVLTEERTLLLVFNSHNIRQCSERKRQFHVLNKIMFTWKITKLSSGENSILLPVFIIQDISTILWCGILSLFPLMIIQNHRTSKMSYKYTLESGCRLKSFDVTNCNGVSL